MNDINQNLAHRRITRFNLISEIRFQTCLEIDVSIECLNSIAPIINQISFAIRFYRFIVFYIPIDRK